MTQATSSKQEHVFLHYTQAELDRNYDQRGWVSTCMAERGEISQRTTSHLSRRSSWRQESRRSL
jgi:hypothetical protein